MGNAFRYTLLSIVRQRDVMFWVMLFPLILATLFYAVFGGLENEDYALDPIPVAIVDQSQNGAGSAFDATVNALSQEGEALLAPVNAASADAAHDLLARGDTVGTITVDAEGWPALELSAAPSGTDSTLLRVERTVLADVVNDFCRTRAAVEDLAATDPAALANPNVLASVAERHSYTSQIALTHSKASEFVRYYYILLGFAAFMAAMVATEAVNRLQPNTSPLGARRAIGGSSRSSQLIAAIGASWLTTFATLVVAFCYIRFALGIDFGGRDAACILGIAVAALMATAFGALLGALPGIASGAKSGILTGLTMLLSFFAGLFGTPTLRLADELARTAPWATYLNPVKLVTDLFYSLYVYTDLAPFFQTLGALLAMTAVFTVVAALLMRRQRYAHL